MKKLILAAACAAASGTIFANSSDTTEQRINLLETELQKLKAELAAQKQTQNNLQVKQVKIEENIEKTKATVTEKPVAPSWVTWTDNVKVYGIARIDAAVDFKSSPDSGGRTTSSLYRTPFESEKRSNHARSDAMINASRLGVYFNSPNKVVTGNIEADFFDSSNMGTGMVNSVFVMHFLPIKTGLLVKHGHSCLIWKPVQNLWITRNLWEPLIRVPLKSVMTGKLMPIMI